MARFTLPRDLYHGKGALEALKTFEGKRRNGLCGRRFHETLFGFLDQAVDYLKAKAGMEVQLLMGIESDPSVETVMRGAKAMEEFQPDWIVAMGGGSPIDAANGNVDQIRVSGHHLRRNVQSIRNAELRRKAHFCAISSATSGVATEVTAFAVITDYKRYQIPAGRLRNHTPGRCNRRSGSGRDDAAKVSFAHTGMDAMTHAIEAYVST